MNRRGFLSAIGVLAAIPALPRPSFLLPIVDFEPSAELAAAVREDLAELIWDISPMNTYFVSNIAHSATSIVHEWDMDALS